nr:hypothetical protein [Candidatus Cloacimonas sp.]
DYYDGIIVVYNFEVEDNHNYYVGDNQVLVHNDGGCTVSDKGAFWGNNARVGNTEMQKLLPTEGDVDTYDKLIKAGKRGDDITPHHAPSAEYMKKFSVSKDDGLCINMEQPKVGGRHRMRFMGVKADLKTAAKTRETVILGRCTVNDNGKFPHICTVTFR